ncbi:HAD-IIIA family hydrolase [Alphaproteobacteria bacterium]|nr:HAD-IIIA family hydrolase [Alphaproteobacteria bacterium]
MKAAFIDRDGVINKDVGYISNWAKFKYQPMIRDGLLTLIKKKFNLVLITNQGGVAKGIIKKNDVTHLHKLLLEDLAKDNIHFLDIKVCYHHPEGVLKEYEKYCDCRKPSPKMILDTALKHNINLRESILIGDRITDIEAGTSAGIELCVGLYGKYFTRDNLYNFPVFNNLNEFTKTI